MTALAFDDFGTLALPTPDVAEVREAYAALHARLNRASGDEAVAVVADWDTLRKRLESWSSLVHIRFSQDTRNDAYKAAREHCDEIAPKFTDLETTFKKAVLAHPSRPALEARFGRFVFDLWACDATTFDPAIEADLVEESKLGSEYVALLSAAEFTVGGETVNMSGLSKFAESADRNLRYEAAAVRWRWFADNAEALDRIYDRLVHLRTGMARKLGFESYTELGYRRMRRTDYGAADVARFREAVLADVVPLAGALRKAQERTLGVDRLMFWDEPVQDPAGNPKPAGGHDDLVAAATTMFDGMGPDLAAFFRLMVARGLLDLKNRSGKAGGGYCSGIAEAGVPFIFANFNGTMGDVEVFTHECGHAFQYYMSRNNTPSDLCWPTYEAAEIHSMSLEFLTWPSMELFFGADAERFRRTHLTKAVLFCPYGTAVDHFQHLVYAEPDATPAERNAMWRRVETQYLPTRNYGDLPHAGAGGVWQQQRHIYLSPFYYIDYVLAQTCALQFWAWSQSARAEALAAYESLCAVGGAKPFSGLVTHAGLRSPFAPGCLADAVTRARTVLGA